jgi:hypothetical protein
LGTAPPEAVFPALAKDAADDHFLPVGAAPQQEQIAGPKIWDQIRSHKAIITMYYQNSINNLTPCGRPCVSADEARKQSTHHTFSGDCQFFFGVGGEFSAGA